jgi:hypothetical protein
VEEKEQQDTIHVVSLTECKERQKQVVFKLIKVLIWTIHICLSWKFLVISCKSKSSEMKELLIIFVVDLFRWSDEYLVVPATVTSKFF